MLNYDEHGAVLQIDRCTQHYRHENAQLDDETIFYIVLYDFCFMLKMIADIQSWNLS